MNRSADAPTPTQDPIGFLLAALERARTDGDMEALVLADLQGLVIAGAGAVWTCAELAAAAPFVREAPGPANDVLPNSLDALARARVVRMQVDGVELLLCGRGGQDDHGLLAAARSARRLLSARRAPVRQGRPLSPELPGGLDSPPAP